MFLLGILHSKCHKRYYPLWPTAAGDANSSRAVSAGLGPGALADAGSWAAALRLVLTPTTVESRTLLQGNPQTTGLPTLSQVPAPVDSVTPVNNSFCLFEMHGNRVFTFEL